MTKPDPYTKDQIQTILDYLHQYEPSTRTVIKRASELELHETNVRIKTDTKEDGDRVRALLLSILPGLSLNNPREGSNPRYEGNQKWFLYGTFQFFDDGTQKKRRRRKS